MMQYQIATHVIEILNAKKNSILLQKNENSINKHINYSVPRICFIKMQE